MGKMAALISASEYLSRELESEVRHEYVAGSVYAMAGGSKNHGLLTKNLLVLLDRHLSDGMCESFGQDIKVRVEAADCYYYPDASISCPPNFIDERSGVIDNPTVLFEVLSPRTRTVDRSSKFANHRTLTSLRDYVLVDSEAAALEVYSLEDEWKVRKHKGLDAVAPIPSVEVRLKLSELYRRVKFEPKSPWVDPL